MWTVYIFGAGASKAVADQSPLMKDFLASAFETFPDDTRIREVRDFVCDFYPGRPWADDAQILWPRLEDLLSQLDLSIAQTRPLSPYYKVPRVQELREHVVYLIAKVLQEKLGSLDDPATRDFVRNVLQEEDTIISLNYDIILDNALLEERGQVNYGTEVRRASKVYRLWRHVDPRQSIQVPLYKLHGSLNWLYCPICQELDITEGQKGALFTFDDAQPAHCVDCGCPYETLIITPTLLKSYANGLLVEVWRCAEKRIVRADHLVFIGYSLADADIEIKCMIKRATYRRLRPKVTVVDIEPPDSGLAERYRRLFGEIEYLSMGFVEYVRERMQGNLT
jgi:hypothetical protein